MKLGIDYCNILGERGQKKHNKEEVLHVFPMWEMASPLPTCSKDPKYKYGHKSHDAGNISAYLSNIFVTRLSLDKKVRTPPSLR